MAEPVADTLPPKLRSTPTGEIDNSSLADLIEWFLMYDERVSRMRHANTEELFQWKQRDDTEQGVSIYPFENAEARFAIGVVQALVENKSEPILKLWITDVLAALSHSRETKLELTTAYDLDADLEAFSVTKSEKLTTNVEKRIYLTSCWLEALCTAEARVLGWVYQEIYGRPFAP
ncbi:MAG: hypothetical protein IPO41_05900 [Acidobacteria bacterium]|nr:hypothetical protein [Acidobacteriota bacterium]MBK9527846.1 hypothetical protein [Acidobacteriota bacterium]MBP7475754.1 hypothetical protein [Pyrinomonadaceae bacterium]MBP9109028.1 hypothetical protein [Pyrinomonadaceae bacterium]